MEPIRRDYDIPNLVRELAENRISSLEIVREALSNSKDHSASRVWIRCAKDNRNHVDVLIIDDGEGMDEERLSAFWGVGSTAKSGVAIGYKGHGTKLFFDCRRLSVATSLDGESWSLSWLDHPLEAADPEIAREPLPSSHRIYAELTRAGLQDGRGTVILLEQIGAEDRAELLTRQKVESYCDWFTVMGDVRSGLFDRRAEFHRVVVDDDDSDGLARHEVPLRALEVRLAVNGEREYRPLGRGTRKADVRFLEPWREDLDEFAAAQPGLVGFGHRFADVHEPKGSAARVRDDRSSLRLTGPEDWMTTSGIGIVARVEGHRRQRETYLEASWQGKSGLYKFNERFGLWLCRDFIPVAQRNDLLQQALEQSSSRGLRFELSSLRNWQVFVNLQMFKPTANRNDIANQAGRSGEIVSALVDILKRAMAERPFRDWVTRLQSAALERSKNREIKQIQRRLEGVREWTSGDDDGVEIADVDVDVLPRLDPEFSLRLRTPRSEQELFYVYGLLSGRHEMPIHIVEYDASHGIDAIGILREPKLLPDVGPQVRVELKYEVRAGHPIHHFFDAIDVIVCWSVERVGDIYEETSAAQGRLQRRKDKVLASGLDTHEIVYEQEGGAARTIPILQLSTLFG